MVRCIRHGMAVGEAIIAINIRQLPTSPAPSPNLNSQQAALFLMPLPCAKLALLGQRVISSGGSGPLSQGSVPWGTHTQTGAISSGGWGLSNRKNRKSENRKMHDTIVFWRNAKKIHRSYGSRGKWHISEQDEGRREGERKRGRGEGRGRGRGGGVWATRGAYGAPPKKKMAPPPNGSRTDL